MTVILVEGPQGYALFKLNNKSLLKASPEEIQASFSSLDSAKKCVSLTSFRKFEDVKAATAEIAEIQEGKIPSGLKKVLKKHLDDSICVWDKALGKTIKKKMEMDVLLSPSVHEIFRGVKTHLDELVAELADAQTTQTMAMALSHSLSRFKLKFSPEKIDIMVIQAVGLLDDLDKELNNLAMRLREWYGFHFPELLKIVSDNSTFARLVLRLGYRSGISASDSFADIVADELEAQIRLAAETSMGSELVEADLDSINQLATRVLELAEYRTSLTDYLKARMEAIAPNLTHIVGEALGARLLAQAGSLVSLAKQPASTVQILGAEKALFRALKAKANTPKYGLIYHAHLVGQANTKVKGKMSRILANKVSLCARTDACGEVTRPTVAIGAKAYCERRLEELSNDASGSAFKSNRTSAQLPSYVPNRIKNANAVPLASTHLSGNDQIGKPEIVKTEPVTEEKKVKKSKDKEEKKDKSDKKDKKDKKEKKDKEDKASKKDKKRKLDDEGKSSSKKHKSKE